MKNLELETVNKLYLELSQFATAVTTKEIIAQSVISEALRRLANMRSEIQKCAKANKLKKLIEMDLMAFDVEQLLNPLIQTSKP